MASQFKYTFVRGMAPKDVTIAAGAVVATDTMTLNVDRTNMTQAEFEQGLKTLTAAALTAKFPPL